MKKLLSQNVDAVVCTTSDKIYNQVGQFKPLCDKAGIPIYSLHKKGVENGAVAALASDYYRMAEELLVPMAIRVLEKGVSPGTMPAAFLDKTFIYLNLKQAGRLGLVIPQEIKAQATRIY